MLPFLPNYSKPRPVIHSPFISDSCLLLPIPSNHPTSLSPCTPRFSNYTTAPSILGPLCFPSGSHHDPSHPPIWSYTRARGVCLMPGQIQSLGNVLSVTLHHGTQCPWHELGMDEALPCCPRGTLLFELLSQLHPSPFLPSISLC